jgi:hypothetical protein
MVRIDVAFLVLAAACLIAGVSLGIVMGGPARLPLRARPRHLNLLGWASLAIFGMAYRLYPALLRSRMALPHLVLSGVSGVMLPAGIYVSHRPRGAGPRDPRLVPVARRRGPVPRQPPAELVFQGRRVHAPEAGLAMGR